MMKLEILSETIKGFLLTTSDFTHRIISVGPI